ncbi:AtpZ/AtpI family protein [Telmatospirillum siberiense]|uniref:ATP synthase protein I n=1 Tax=Telmatospirillum siberiense TaxID=382514 RepID=A0A2N3PTN1_9PROT|nr:AtpZ/AtpI family protein [Telmatospirillum siberiense]PKU23762.1 F0F1 ATP synthase subunit I [Telmatospirillum siberiense]
MSDEPREPRPLDDFDDRLRKARGLREVETRRETSRGGGMTGMGLGFRIATELVAGIAVGTLLGYVLDGWLGTRPWLMVVFLFLGAAAGTMNVYRAAKGLDDAVGLGEAQRRKERDRTNDS